ncbi:MAG: hypothetical protein N3A00_04275 [Thermodesulfovibrio sp.]|nr:hypothetical protein [Thermodesulfovibrio sp.]
MKRNSSKGFITIDILIAGVILTAGIAASAYLFRLGFDYLDRANKANTIALKISQTPALLRTLDFEKESGKEELGDGVMLSWTAKLLSKSRPATMTGEAPVSSMHELYLYEVTLSFEYKDLIRTYKVNVFRSKSLSGTDTSPI